MKPFAIGKTVYRIPEGWREVKLKQFIALHTQLPKEGEAWEVKHTLSWASLLTGIDEQTLLQASTRTMGRLVERLAWARQPVPEQSPLFEFKFRGHVYRGTQTGFDATFRQMVDAFMLQKHHEDIKFMPYIMAIFYLRHTREGGSEDYGEDVVPQMNERVALMENVDVLTAMGAAAFFLLLGKLSKKNIPVFFGEMIQKLETVATSLPATLTSEKSMAGSTSFIASQITRSIELMTSFRNRLGAS